MTKISVLIITFLLATQTHICLADVWFNFGAESYSHNDDLPIDTNPDYNFWHAACYNAQEDCGTIYSSPLTAPEGTKYWEIEIGAAQDDYGTELQYATELPLNLSSGSTYYMGYFVRVERIGGTDVWSATAGTANKGTEMLGTGIRWEISEGDGWMGGDTLADHRWTIWIGNATYHLNRGAGCYCENAGDDTIPLNQEGYSASNQIELEYERWYAFVLGITISTTTSGRIQLWVNGTKLADYTGCITSASESATIDKLVYGGTVAQNTYNCPAHKRQYDKFILTNSWSDIEAAGLDQDPEAEGGTSATMTGVSLQGGSFQ